MLDLLILACVLGHAVHDPHAAITSARRSGTQPLGAVLGRPGELEDKSEEPRPRHTAFGPIGAVAHRAEHRLDRVGGAQVHPVFGREV